MKIILLAHLILLYGTCLAQKNFVKGTIVTSNGEMIEGYINYRETTKSFATVEFKKNKEEKKSQTYTVSDLKSFEISGLEKYTKYICKVSMDYRDLNSLSRGIDSTFKTDTLFLRELSSGRYLTLLSYQDKIKNRFYMLNANDIIPQELIYKVYLDPNNASDFIIESHQFRNQLKQSAELHNTATVAVINQAAIANYYASDLEKLADLINGNNESRAMGKTSLTGRKKWYRFFAAGGLSNSKVSYTRGSDFFAPQFNFPASNSPVISLGMDLIFKAAIGRTLLRQELSFYRGSYIDNTEVVYPTTVVYHTYQLKMQVIYSSTSLVHHFYNKNKLKFFLGCGVNYYWMTFPENKQLVTRNNQTTESGTVNFKKTTVGFNLRSGATLAERFTIGYNYDFPALMSSYNNFKFTLASHQLRLYYLFKH